MYTPNKLTLSVLARTFNHSVLALSASVVLFLWYEGCSESKERLCIQPAQLFHCIRSVIWCVQYSVDSYLVQLVCSEVVSVTGCDNERADIKSRRL